MSVIEMRFCFSFWQLVCVALILLITPQFSYSQDVLDTSESIITPGPEILEPDAIPTGVSVDAALLQPNGDIGVTESNEEKKELEEDEDEKDEDKEEAEEVKEEVVEENEAAKEIEEEIEEEKEEAAEEEKEEAVEEEKEAEEEKDVKEEAEVAEAVAEEKEEEIKEIKEETTEVEIEEDKKAVDAEVKEEIEEVKEEKTVEVEVEDKKVVEAEEKEVKEEKSVEVETEDKKVVEAEEKVEVEEEKAVEVEKKVEAAEEKVVEVEEEKTVEVEKEDKKVVEVEEEKVVEVEKEEDKKVVEVEEKVEVEEEKVVEVEKEEDKKAAEAEEKEESEIGKVEPKSDLGSIPEPEPESDEPVEKKTNVGGPTPLPENDAALATSPPPPAAETTDAPKRATKVPKKPKKKPRKKPKKPRKKGTKAPKKATTAAPTVPTTTTTPKIITTTTPKIITTTTPKIITTTTPKIVLTSPKTVLIVREVITEAPKKTPAPVKPQPKKEEPCVDVFSVEEKRYQCKGYWKRGLTILGLQINKLKKENQELFLKVVNANGKIKLAQESIAEYKINVKALKKKFAWPNKDNLGNTHKDCSDAFKKDHKKPGVYLIHPVGSPYKVHLLCVDGWTVIQRRFDGSEDFHRSFDEYLSGFGNFSGEFFVGLENLHRMTLSQSYTLRVDVKSAAGKWYFAVYNNFAVSDETDQFRLKLGNMTASNSDDVMDQSRDKPFSSYDRDNDDWSGGNCAQHFRGGWWSGNCITNLNQMWCSNGCLRWGDTRVVSSIMRIRPTSTADPDDMTETPNPVGFSIKE